VTLVIGGGVAGPVPAIALRRAGIDATVYEAYPTTADGVGGSLAIAPNGLAALRTIGAEDAVLAVARPISRMAMAVGTRCFLEQPGLPDLPPLQLLWRADLQRVLHDRAVAQGIRITHGKRLVDAEEATSGITARRRPRPPADPAHQRRPAPGPGLAADHAAGAALAPWPDGAGRRRGARAVQHLWPGRLPGDRERTPAGPLPA
jgi:hypothetical protein